MVAPVTRALAWVTGTAAQLSAALTGAATLLATAAAIVGGTPSPERRERRLAAGLLLGVLALALLVSALPEPTHPTPEATP